MSKVAGPLRQTFVTRRASRVPRWLSLAAGLLLVGFILGPKQASAQQSPEQQGCINTLNKGLAKVVKTQGKEATRCVKQGGKGKLVGTIEDCLTADSKGKVDKAQAQTVAKASALCGVSPDFAATTAATVNAAATTAANAVIHGMFGANLDVGVISDANDPVGAKCQTAVAKETLKCLDTKLKEFKGCIKNALKGKDGPAATTAQELQDACLGTGANPMPDPKGKIAKACDPVTGKLATKAILKKCVDEGVSLGGELGPFPGCAGNFGAVDAPEDLGACLEQLVECQLCLALNEADFLARDCDLFDNGLDDSSCQALQLPLELTVTLSKLIYEPGETVMATVDIASVVAIDGSLEVAVVDPEADPNVFFQDVIPVSVPANGQVQVPVEFTGPAQDGVYIIVAQLPTSIVTAEDTGAFGIRPASQQHIPDTILRVRLATLDVTSLRSTLVTAAAINGPLRIQLGNFDFAMRVQPGSALGFDPNAMLPAAFNGMLMFEGVLTTCVGGSADGSPCEDDSECPGGACEPDPNSLVTFTLGPDDPNGNDLNAMFMAGPGNVVWVEPLGIYDPNAAPDQHLFYHTNDVFLEPQTDGSVITGALGGTTPMTARDARTSQTPRPLAVTRQTGRTHTEPFVTVHGDVRMNVYEHSRGDKWARRRCQSFHSWAVLIAGFTITIGPSTFTLPGAFSDVQPRDRTFVRLRVDRVVVGIWTNISDSGFGGTCAQVIALFQATVPTEARRFHVLFTNKGDDCSGIGGLAQLPGFAVVRDDKDVQRMAIVLGQEVGHNWDWHVNPLNVPHNEHTETVSESWDHKHWYGTRKHCTIMHAGYGGCDHMELRYHRNDPRILTHLADGIWRNMDTTCSLARAPQCDGACGTNAICFPQPSGSCKCESASSPSCMAFDLGPLPEGPPICGGTCPRDFVCGECNERGCLSTVDPNRPLECLCVSVTPPP